ncbi:hypothetical protein Sjap_018467 [Stephania japonica]|uniref:Uncharacterized protein n=1 Tax=Stephania japonica TaxID=461633 RepID=A0AAP0NJE4_9MAGN
MSSNCSAVESARTAMNHHLELQHQLRRCRTFDDHGETASAAMNRSSTPNSHLTMEYPLHHVDDYQMH